MARMLGWLSAATARASCSKRRSRSVSAANDTGITLIATSRPSRGSRARYTSPIPPAPSGARTSYGPSFVPEARAIPARHYIPNKRGVAADRDDSGRIVRTLVQRGARGVQKAELNRNGFLGTTCFEDCEQT